jgi:hypothetical protein
MNQQVVQAISTGTTLGEKTVQEVIALYNANNKVAVLKLEGTNPLESMSMVFPNFETGLAYITEIIGEPEETGVHGETMKEYGKEVPNPDAGCRFASWGNMDEKLSNEEEEEEEEEGEAEGEFGLSDKFLRFYYDGCGPIFGFTLIEANFGVPLVGWDLD